MASSSFQGLDVASPARPQARPGSPWSMKQLEEVADGVGVQRFNQLAFVSDCWEPVSVPRRWGEDRTLKYTFWLICNTCQVRVLDCYSFIPTYPLDLLHFLESLSWVELKTLRALSLQKCSFHILPVRIRIPTTRMCFVFFFPVKQEKKTAVSPQEWNKRRQIQIITFNANGSAFICFVFFFPILVCLFCLRLATNVSYSPQYRLITHQYSGVL